MGGQSRRMGEQPMDDLFFRGHGQARAPGGQDAPAHAFRVLRAKQIVGGGQAAAPRHRGRPPDQLHRLIPARAGQTTLASIIARPRRGVCQAHSRDNGVSDVREVQRGGRAPEALRSAAYRLLDSATAGKEQSEDIFPPQRGSSLPAPRGNPIRLTPLSSAAAGCSALSASGGGCQSGAHARHLSTKSAPMGYGRAHGRRRPERIVRVSNGDARSRSTRWSWRCAPRPWRETARAHHASIAEVHPEPRLRDVVPARRQKSVSGRWLHSSWRYAFR